MTPFLFTDPDVIENHRILFGRILSALDTGLYYLCFF